jgi:hypothetical protein
MQSDAPMPCERSSRVFGRSTGTPPQSDWRVRRLRRCSTLINDPTAMRHAVAPPFGSLLRERPGIWALKDLVTEMRTREWSTSDKAVEVAVHRLARAGEARRVRNGVYEFPERKEGAIESDASGVA